MEPTIIGIIGCGNISDAYLKGAARSQLIRVKSCADLNAEAAQAKASEYGISAVPVDALLADPRPRDRHQPHRAAGARPGQPADHHRRQARLFREAAGRTLHRGPGADAGRCRPRRARRLRARYLPRCRPSGLPAGDRCRADRPAGRRRRGRAVARDGALAPEPRVLLQARRRPDPRHRALLRDPAGQPARAGHPGHRPGLDREPHPHRDQRTASRPGDRGRGADHRQRGRCPSPAARTWR